MHISIPIAQICDILVIGDQDYACRLACHFQKSGRKVCLCTPGNSFVESGLSHCSPAQQKYLLEQELINAKVDFLYEVIGIAPAVTTAGRLSGWLFVARNGFFTISAKCVIDYRHSPSPLCNSSRYFFKPNEEKHSDILQFSRPEELQLTTDTFNLPQTSEFALNVEFAWHTPIVLPVFRNSKAVSCEFPVPPPNDHADVVVIGGGHSGCAAAIAAAQLGVHTVLVERLSCLGGGNKVYSSEQWLSMLRRTHIDVCMNTVFAGVIMDNRKVAGVVLASDDGRLYTYQCTTVIDASSCAVVARAAGARMEECSANEALCFRSNADCIDYPPYKHGSSQPIVVCSDAPYDLTRAFAVIHDRCKDSFDVPECLHIPEQSRVVSEMVIQPQDILMRRTYRDTIAVIHGAFSAEDALTHPIFLLQTPDNTQHTIHISLRTLMPLKVDGLLVIGRGLSMHRDCIPALTNPESLLEIGTAAGHAAAFAIINQTSLREISIAKLQKLLIDKKLLPPDITTENDGAQGALNATSLTGTLAGIFFRPDIARRRLQADFEKKPDLMTATVLAFLGDATGRTFLQNAIAKANWNNGWEYENNVSSVINSSPLDALIYALRTIGGSPNAAYSQLKTLTVSHKLSHIRAVALYFMRWPTSVAAKELERLLADESLQLEIPTTFQAAQAENHLDLPYCEILNRHLKRLYISAALFACHPLSLSARQGLEKYRSCLQYHFAVFAMQHINR